MRNGDLSYVTLGVLGGRWRLKLWYYRGNCGVEEYRTQGVNEGPGVHRFRKSGGLEAGGCWNVMRALLMRLGKGLSPPEPAAMGKLVFVLYFFFCFRRGVTGPPAFMPP